MTAPKPPSGLKASGRALWKSTLTDYELDQHKVAVLLQACRTADALDGLQALLDTDGFMSSTSQGPRIHPALVELRQQRIAFARLIAALRIPAGLEDDRPDARPGVRGVYGVAGGAS